MSEYEQHKAWLASLQPGDEVVIVRHVGMGAGYNLHQVSRLTKTRIFVRISKTSESTFRRADGHEIASGMYSCSIEQPTEDHRISIRRRFMIYRIKECKWSELTTDVLTQIVGLITDPKSKLTE